MCDHTAIVSCNNSLLVGWTGCYTSTGGIPLCTVTLSVCSMSDYIITVPCIIANRFVSLSFCALLFCSCAATCCLQRCSLSCSASNWELVKLSDTLPSSLWTPSIICCSFSFASFSCWAARCNSSCCLLVRTFSLSNAAYAFRHVRYCCPRYTQTHTHTHTEWCKINRSQGE